MVEKLTLNRQECLKSRKTIKSLFYENRKISYPPIKLLWKNTNNQSKIVVAFTVPKRNFKLATDRNRIKRQMREAYRLNKNIIQQQVLRANTTLNCMFIFTSYQKEKYIDIEKAIIQTLKRLSFEIENSSSNNKKSEKS